MNRRNFFGLLGKCLAVGAALGVAPSLLERAETVIRTWTYEWVQVGGPPMTGEALASDETYAFEIRFNPGDGTPPSWFEALSSLDEKARFVGKARS